MAETQVQSPQREDLTLEGNELATLLQKEFKPKSDEAKGAVEQAVRTLAEQALSQTKLIGSDVVKSIEAIIAELDRKLSEQVNLILHHSDFQQLEEDRWIKDAADELKARALRNDFDALAIVAPPRALGTIKKSLHKEVERRLVRTINKEMSGRPTRDIEALFEAQREELPAV